MADDRRVRAVTGPVGSGKTTAMIFELLRRAMTQTPDSNGVRRTRFAVVRNTLSQLKQTCLVSIEQSLRDIYKFKVSDSTIQFRFGDVYSDWLLLPLDEPQSQQRLLSLELTGGWCSEFRELDPDLVRALLSRCGRYPSKLVGGATWDGIVMESNGFSIDSPWYEILELEKPANWGYHRQPGGMEPNAENRENLRERYYEDLLESNTPEWCKIHVHNEYGDSLAGQAVFKNSFRPDFHVAKGPLRPVNGHPLIIGMDFARHPAAIICQVDHRGRMLCLKELERENSGVEAFINKMVYPELQKDRYRGLSSFIVGDPAGRQRSQIGEESVFDMLSRVGFSAYAAQTNNIDPRLRAVEKFLIQQRDGGAALLLDPEGCPLLLRAMKHEYKYKKKRDGNLESKPDKVRPWADLVDALQYACLGTARNVLGRVMRRAAAERPPEPNSVGWT